MKLKIERVLKTPIVNHLSWIMIDDTCEAPMFECFSNEQLFGAQLELQYAYVVNYVAYE